MENEVTRDTQDKTIAIVAYLTIIGLVVALVLNNEKRDLFAKYHIRQSLGLVLTSLALSLINVIPILGWIVSMVGAFVLLYMWVMGLLNAINGREKPVPILGEKYEEWLKSV
ncbi:MAG: hypothetical protein GX670_10190 [Bacteroidales bacterium]|nr:hypothetical protein [Bacteroidales bacterium]HHX31675.1 hypothetical protein [Bacteroidales bacterium]